MHNLLGVHTKNIQIPSTWSHCKMNEIFNRNRGSTNHFIFFFCFFFVLIVIILLRKFLAWLKNYRAIVHVDKESQRLSKLNFQP